MRRSGGTPSRCAALSDIADADLVCGAAPAPGLSHRSPPKQRRGSAQDPGEERHGGINGQGHDQPSQSGKPEDGLMFPGSLRLGTLAASNLEDDVGLVGERSEPKGAEPCQKTSRQKLS